MGVSEHDTLGQRPPVLLQAFSSCIPATGGAQIGLKLLSSQWQRVSGPGVPHYDSNAGYGRRRSTRRLGFTTPSRRVRFQQFGQRGNGISVQRDSHG